MTSTPDAAAAAPYPSVRPRYDGLSMGLHWATVLLVLGQFATAWSVDRVDPALARTVLGVHRSSGAALWMLVAFRLAWRLIGMRLPPFPPSMAKWHISGVHLSEYGLYALLLLQPVSGLLDTLWHGRPFDLLFWRIPALLPRDKTMAALAHAAHMTGAYALAALIGLHAGAALFHHFVLRDGVLRSMLPGRR